MPTMSRRVETFSDSTISRMTQIANEVEAINLSQGFPDFPPPKALTDRLKKVADEGPHQYPVTFGAPNLREAVARKQTERIGGRTIDPENEVVITCGGTEAMMCTMMTICDPGDKVVVFSPFYESYDADTILAGAEPVFVPLTPPTYEFDPDKIEDAFKQGAKAIIICNPNNPCGKVFTREELMTIGELALKYDAYVIADEVYEYMVYEPHEHTCMASLPGMWDHTITCNSFSKTYSITGWRLGWIIGPEDFIERAKKIHIFLTVAAPAPLQEAAIAGLEMPDSYYKELLATYTEMRDYFLAGLDRIGMDHNDPAGSYFVMIDISKYLALEAFAGYDDCMFCEWMIRNLGVAAVPGSSFFREPIKHLIRMHFARSRKTVDEALRRLSRINEYI